jgi:hypothetical protein
MQGAAPASGTSSTLSVTTTRDCTWTATSAQSWLTITDGTNGQGSGSVSYKVAANPQPAQRRGTLAVNSNQIGIVQDPAPCQFRVSPASTSAPMSGGTVTVSVEVLAGCAWAAASQSSWITIASSSSGNGSGSVTLNVAANAGDGRSGSATIGGQTVTITQGAAPCTFAIAPPSQNVQFDGANTSVAVTVRPGCAWTAASGAPWITIASGASGNGNGTVAVSVAANPGDARSGAVSIAGQTATISQAAAPCTYAIAPGSQNAPAQGGSGSVAVTVRPGCGWTATSGVPWITIGSAASGSGNGTVAFTIAPNPTVGVARTGALTIAGQTFTVSQAAVACTYTIAPAGQSIAGEGGNGSTIVTAAATCAWTAVANVPWITIVSGGSGTGNGAVAFTIAPNPGPGARSGTLTVAGQIYTVAQAEPCSFALAPWGQSFSAAGGIGTVALTASAPTCGWGAASTETWLVVLSSPTGNVGSGTVTFSVAPNFGPPRSAQLIIGLRRFDVSQDQP